VAVALGNKIYQWNATSGTVDELQNFDQIEAHPTLTKWSKEGQFCAVGFSDGQLKVFIEKLYIF
jgi:cell division cycle protein 20 (cofactor of APC complex)